MGAPLIGARIERKEDYRFLTGAGQYTDDVDLPRQSHAAFVRSPHAHAVVKNVKLEKARNSPGVLAIYTGEDFAAAKLGGLPCGWLITDVNGQPMKEPSPSSSPRPSRRRAMPPSWSKWTTRSCRQ
jgi:carbon-monoxide dehydrogenase large subunit